jgi:hypothetical protein
MSRKLYNKLKRDKRYKDVDFDDISKGVKATHINHSIDPNRGEYEIQVQEIGYKNGHSVILEEEIQNVYKHKNAEGTWDGEIFEIAGSETGLSNNIRNSLKHCASKPETEIAILYFPNDNFSIEEFELGYSKFKGLANKKDGQYRKFEVVYCLQKDKGIIHIKKPD